MCSHLTALAFVSNNDQQVVWADQWWRKTARVVDDAIDRAVQVRDATAKHLSEEDRARRTDEVSAVLRALAVQQQVASQAEAGSEKKTREQKQKEGDARREKRSQEASLLAQQQQQQQQQQQPQLQLDSRKPLTVEEARAAARLQELTARFEEGSVAATLAQLQRVLGPSLSTMTAEGGGGAEAAAAANNSSSLESPSFEVVHRLVAQLLRATEYMQGSFSAVEFNGGSRYMQYPINRVNFVNKVVKGVARDLGLPPAFVSAKQVVGDPGGPRPETARLFLCLLAQAATAPRGSRTDSSNGGGGTAQQKQPPPSQKHPQQHMPQQQQQR
jgi:hypothetical protein